MAGGFYLAEVDANGVQCVQRLESEVTSSGLVEDEADVVRLAEQFPTVIYFWVEQPPNYVGYYVSRDVDSTGVLNTWSVYVEQYDPADLDNPLDGTSHLVGTYGTEHVAERIASELTQCHVQKARAL